MITIGLKLLIENEVDSDSDLFRSTWKKTLVTKEKKKKRAPQVEREKTNRQSPLWRKVSSI